MVTISGKPFKCVFQPCAIRRALDVGSNACFGFVCGDREHTSFLGLPEFKVLVTLQIVHFDFHEWLLVLVRGQLFLVPLTCLRPSVKVQFNNPCISIGVP